MAMPPTQDPPHSRANPGRNHRRTNLRRLSPTIPTHSRQRWIKFSAPSPTTKHAADIRISGNAIWRITPQGTAELWTSETTNPLLVSPDGVKVYNNAIYTSISGGEMLRIPINPDGSAGTATVWAQDPGVWFDDMTLDNRTGDVYVARLDTNQLLLRITPSRDITPIASPRRRAARFGWRYWTIELCSASGWNV